MKLWTQRFFGSVRVMGLQGEHRLIYLGLLVAEWGLDGRGLPNDLDELARVLGISASLMKEAWGDGSGRVSQFFFLRDGRLFNDTLEDELRETKLFLERCSASGKVGRAKQLRLKKRSGGGPGVARTSRVGDGDGDDDGFHPDGGKKEATGEGLEERRVEVEGFYEEDRELVEAVQRFARCGRAKAREIYHRLREPKSSTLEAWMAFERSRGTPATLGAMQAFAHPDEVREDVSPPSFRDRDQRQLKTEIDSAIKNILEAP